MNLHFISALPFNAIACLVGLLYTVNNFIHLNRPFSILNKIKTTHSLIMNIFQVLVLSKLQETFRFLFWMEQAKNDNAETNNNKNTNAITTNNNQ